MTDAQAIAVRDSERGPSLVTKLAEVMAAVERIPKRGRNDFHKYDYATEADIVSTVRQELASRHVMLIPEVGAVRREPVGDKGSVLTTLEMTFTFLDGESSDSITRKWVGCGSDKDDKGIYKAMTGGEKYFLLKTFLMPTGDDPEREEKATKTKGGYTVTPQKPVVSATPVAPAVPAVAPARDSRPSAQNGGDSGASPDEADLGADLPEGAVLLKSVTANPTNNPNVRKFKILTHQGEEVTTINERYAALAEQCCQDRVPVVLVTKVTKWGTDLVSLHGLSGGPPVREPDDAIPTIDVKDIAF